MKPHLDAECAVIEEEEQKRVQIGVGAGVEARLLFCSRLRLELHAERSRATKDDIIVDQRTSVAEA